MRRSFPSTSAAWAAVFGLAVFAAPAVYAGDNPAPVTYAKDVSRILQKRCQECHNPDGIAPFSLLTYRQARGWARMIREVVTEGRMPPWHADPNHGEFRNDRRLTDDELDKLLAWIDNGKPMGDEADLPAPLEFYDGWRIGEPDMIFQMPEEVTVQPTGVVPYMHIEAPTKFEEDVWVQKMDALPGNAKVVHHILVLVREERHQGGPLEEFLRLGQGFLTGYAPGTEPVILPEDHAIRIPKGATLVFQMHYTPTGKTETDRSSFGLVLADGPPKHEHHTATTINFDFKIPAHDPNFRVEADTVFPHDALLFSMTPHMHYRGKSFEYIAHYPDGKTETLLRVPNYDFNWQTAYILEEPAFIPKGTRLETIAHFDNSENNPYNPDPTKPVRWGEQTWEEMMIGWMTLAWTDGPPE